MSIVSLVSHSTFLIVPLSHSSFSNINHNYLHIFLYFLLLLATSSFLSPTLLFFISFHVLLLVHYDITGLFPLLISHPLIHKLSLSSIPALLLSAIHPHLIFFYYISFWFFYYYFS